MLQSISRTIANHLTTNWPILWAARLDVALACGVLLLVLDVPIYWLGQRVEQQNWGGLTASGNRALMWIAASSALLGAIIRWPISVGRVDVRGISPRMVKHPGFIDLLLGTVVIVTPVVAFGYAMPSDENVQLDVGL